MKTIPDAILLVLLIVAGCTKYRAHKNVCPIDGQSPEWSRQLIGKTCEYFHYNVVERTTHSWSADCENNVAK